MSPSVSSRAGRPTLLVFTLGPRADAERRRLLGGRAESLENELFADCLGRALEAGRACGLSLRVSSPRPLDEARTAGADVAGQRGTGFAARFRHAVEQAFVEGCGPLLVVGSDTPDLAAGHVAAALAALDADPDAVVVGPARDGGFYLLAAARPLDGALSQVPFRAGETRRLLCAALAAAGRPVVLLEPLADLDRRRDLERWLAAARGRAGQARSGAWKLLLARLLRWLADLGLAEPVWIAAPRLASLPVAAGRAPPSR